MEKALFGETTGLVPLTRFYFIQQYDLLLILILY